MSFGKANHLGYLINNPRTVNYRKLYPSALAVSVGSLLLMMLRWANGIQGIEVYYCFPWAIGSGLLLSAQFLALTICSPEGQMASATAVYYLSQQIGQIIGTSVSTVALQRLFRLRLELGLGDVPSDQKVQVSLCSALKLSQLIIY